MTDPFIPLGTAGARMVDNLRPGIERLPIRSRTAWLAYRRRDVTASDIGSLFGCHPYRSALNVYADKTGGGVDRGDNAAMRNGRILQPAVAEAVKEERPNWVLHQAENYLRDSALHLGATPDYLVSDPAKGLGILECKTAIPSIFERDWTNGVPLCWTLQCLVQMMLTDRQWGAVAVLVTSRDFPVYIYDVPRHPAAEARIIEAVKQFWLCVEMGQPPAADYAKDGAAIAAMFPRERGDAIDLSTSNRLPEILARRSELSATIKDAEAEKDAIDCEIKDALGEAPEGRLPGWRITWRTQHRKETIIPAKDIRVLRISDLRAKENSI